MWRLAFISCLVLSSSLMNTAQATEYVYRDLMANTLSSTQCEVDSEARESATKSYNIDRYSKKFCQTQGYGWHVDKVKNNGNTVCSPCGDQQTLNKCHQEDVIVTCKRIKPGSVGMLPGKG